MAWLHVKPVIEKVVGELKGGPVGWVVAGVSARGDEHLRYSLKDECQLDSTWQVAIG